MCQVNSLKFRTEVLGGDRYLGLWHIEIFKDANL